MNCALYGGDVMELSNGMSTKVAIVRQRADPSKTVIIPEASRK